MRSGIARAAVILAAGFCLAACSSSDNLFGKFGAQNQAADAAAPVNAFASADGTPVAGAPVALAGANQPHMLGDDPNDDLALGKKQFRAKNYGVAEKYFRHAVEMHPKDAEAWLGLAACYDQLRRFDLADRAYGQAIHIVGPTVEILNNQGYSYMMRGDYQRARETLMAAERKDPGNRYVQNNIALLQESQKKGKAVE
jgi:Flp pilus assembly protein TadD